MKLDSATVLTLIFIALKLMGYITWSWWWVLSPLWISFVLGILIFVVVYVVQVSSNSRR